MSFSWDSGWGEHHSHKGMIMQLVSFPGEKYTRNWAASTKPTPVRSTWMPFSSWWNSVAVQRTTSISRTYRRQASFPISPLLSHKPMRENLRFYGVLLMLKSQGSLEVISSNPSFYRGAAEACNGEVTCPKSHNGKITHFIRQSSEK